MVGPKAPSAEWNQMARLAILLWFVLLTTVAPAESWTTSDKAKLEIKKAPAGFQVTLTNQQKKPLAVVPISSGWTHCWKVVVKDAQGKEYGLVVPPGPAFMTEPGRFTLLQPGKSMSARYKYKDFVRVNRQTDTVESLKKPAEVQVAYTFQPQDELKFGLRFASPPVVQGGEPDPQVKEIQKAWDNLFAKADFLLPLSSSLKS